MSTVSYHLPDCPRSMSRPNQTQFSEMLLVIVDLMNYKNWAYLIESEINIYLVKNGLKYIQDHNTYRTVLVL